MWIDWEEQKIEQHIDKHRQLLIMFFWIVSLFMQSRHWNKNCSIKPLPRVMSNVTKLSKQPQCTYNSFHTFFNNFDIGIMIIRLNITYQSHFEILGKMLKFYNVWIDMHLYVNSSKIHLPVCECRCNNKSLNNFIRTFFIIKPNNQVHLYLMVMFEYH